MVLPPHNEPKSLTGNRTYKISPNLVVKTATRLINTERVTDHLWVVTKVLTY